LAKLSITLKIAGTSYPFPEIESSEEEVYRHAEREVNKLFAENAHPSLLPKDRLALAALALAMENVKLRTGLSPDADLDRLAAIDRQLDDYLRRTEKQ
jgi:phosphomannomutase